MNNEIEVGEYVRTDNGEIHRVIDIEKGSIKIKSQYKEWIGLCCIAKHSNNIIDLIECGDYVNGKEVYLENGELAIELAEHMPPYELLKDIDIKSIVTKEQYKSVEYVF